MDFIWQIKQELIPDDLEDFVFFWRPTKSIIFVHFMHITLYVKRKQMDIVLETHALLVFDLNYPEESPLQQLTSGFLSRAAILKRGLATFSHQLL